MAGETESQGTVEEMAAALRSATGATATPPPAETKPVTTTETTSDDTDDGQPEAAADKATETDPWAALKELGSPEEIRERLEKQAEVEANAKAMRREASSRNEAAARDRMELERLKGQVETAYSRNQQLIDAAAMASGEGNEQLALQFLRMAGSHGGPQANAQGVPTNGQDPKITHLEQELAALKQQQQQYTFGDGYSRVANAALDTIARDPFFQDSDIQKLGVPAQVKQTIIDRVYAMAKDDPTAVNVWDRESLDRAIGPVFREVKSYYDKLQKTFVSKYRAERKAANLKAPPAAKGPSASARSAPPSGLPEIPKGTSRRDEDALYVQAMAAAMRAARPATEV